MALHALRSRMCHPQDSIPGPSAFFLMSATEVFRLTPGPIKKTVPGKSKKLGAKLGRGHPFRDSKAQPLRAAVEGAPLPSPRPRPTPAVWVGLPTPKWGPPG